LTKTARVIAFEDSPPTTTTLVVTDSAIQSSTSAEFKSIEKSSSIPEMDANRPQLLLNLFSPLFQKFLSKDGGGSHQVEPEKMDDNGVLFFNDTLALNVEDVASSSEEEAQSRQKYLQQQVQQRKEHEYSQQLCEEQIREDEESAGEDLLPDESSRHPTEDEKERMEGENDDENDDLFEDSFDPYLFIAALPKDKRNLIKPAREKLLPERESSVPATMKTLVLDLDETLVHCSVESFPNPDFTFPVVFNENLYTVHVRCRPGWREFLQVVSQFFEVVVFTASQEIYAKTLLDKLDPTHELIKYRLFRESCVCVDGNFLKDLDFLNRDLAKTIIVDNAPQSFAYQLENGIPIKSFFDDSNDRELNDLLPLLKTLSNVPDVRPIIRDRFRLAAKVAKAKEQHGFL